MHPDVPPSLANMSKDLMYYDTNAEDPNLGGDDEVDPMGSYKLLICSGVQEDSDEDDFRILATDGVLIAARKGEDDFSHLQVSLHTACLHPLP